MKSVVLLQPTTYQLLVLNPKAVSRDGDARPVAPAADPLNSFASHHSLAS